MAHRSLLLLPLAASLLLACGGSARTQGDPMTSAGSGGEAAFGNVGGANGGAAGSGAGRGGLQGVGGEIPILQAHLGPGSWEMKGTVTPNDDGNDFIKLDCPSVDFVLNVSKTPAGYQLTVGRDGRIDGTSAEIVDGSYVAANVNLPWGSSCHVDLLETDQLSLWGVDSDGDGEADRVVGSLTAQARIIQGDVGETKSVHIELVGTPDVTKSALKVPTTTNPLFPPTFVGSEPLSLTSSLTLVGATKLPLTALPVNGSTSGKALSAAINFGIDTILPLSGSWAVEGTAPDLAGNPLGSSGTLNTLADPGVFLQDGFEGPLVAAIEATGSSLVSAVGSIPAISGKQSLWILPTSSLTFHLKRAANEKTVRLSARTFSHQQGFVSTADIRAGVIGGKEVSMAPYMQGGMPADTGDDTWKDATPTYQVTVPINEPGSDVLVRVTSVACYGLCPPQVALMVDDLRLE